MGEQERRRAEYTKAKASGKVAKAVPATPFCCRGSNDLHYGHDNIHDDIIGNPSRSAELAAPTRHDNDNDVTIFTDSGPAELLKQVSRVMAAGSCKRIFFELCCGTSSNLAANAPPGSCVIGVTEATDLAKTKSYRVLRDLVKRAAEKKISIFVWASVPCTSGCPWKHVNNNLGRKTGDIKKTNVLIQHAVKLCSLAAGFGGKVCWEWPVRCGLWHDPRVYDMACAIKGKFTSVSTSATGLRFRRSGKDVYIKKRWCIMSNDQNLLDGLQTYTSDPNEGSKTFVECRGRIAKNSADYTEVLAR